MAVDTDTVRRIAMLARLNVPEDELDGLAGELNKILNWMDLLNGADTDGVAPMTAVKPMPLRQRADAVTEGGIADDLVANTPEAAGAFFTVPKVIE